MTLARTIFARRPALVGGAVKGHRGGCGLAMLALVLTPVLASAGDAAPVHVPSGQSIHFMEMLWDEPGDGLVYRFRFVAPAIGQQDGPGFEDVADDMEFLCTQYALPRIANTGPQPRQIVISLSDRAHEFGVADPDVTAFFEAYTVQDDICIWEMF